MYVLWLSSWYPNKTSPYNGDFIARHAAATSIYIPVVLVHAVKDPESKLVRTEESRLIPGCRQVIIYYPRSSSIPWLEKMASTFWYVFLQLKIIRGIFKEQGRPSFIHLHIIMKAGIVALILKKLFRIPFIVSEQSTRYLKEDISPYHKSSVFTRWLIRSTLASASNVTAVSKVLGEALKDFESSIEPIVIPNVVDGKIFYTGLSRSPSEPFRLIHISNFFFQKNTADILAAYAILQESDPGKYELVMVGGAPDNKMEQKKWELLGVEFAGEMDQQRLAERLRNSHALILYSRYETFGCVIIEAMACGLPVVVSDIEVFHETVSRGFNGVFAAPENPQQLAEEIRNLKADYNRFNPVTISEKVLNTYSFEKVGKAFSDLYRKGLPSS